MRKVFISIAVIVILAIGAGFADGDRKSADTSDCTGYYKENENLQPALRK